MDGQGITADEKRCTKCGKLKSKTEFHKYSREKDGLNQKCKECVLAWYRKYQKSEKHRDYSKRFYQEHRDTRCESARASRVKHPETRRRWRILNSKKIAKQNYIDKHRRRARLLQAPGSHTLEEAMELLTGQYFRCANPYCAKDLTASQRELDHIVPLCRGGSDSIKNCQWLCKPCNRRKHAVDQNQWLERESRRHSSSK